MSLLSAVLQEVNNATSEEMKKHRDILLPKIKDLSERVQMLSWALQHNLIDTYINFTVTKSLEQLNYKNRKGNIENEFKTCSEVIKTLREQFEVFDDEFTSCWHKLCKSYDYFQELCVASEGKRVLERANHEFGRFNYSEAMLAIQELKQDVRKLKLEGNLVKALSNLNAQAENQLALYTAHLSTEWEDIFTWSEKKGLHYLTYSLAVQQSDPILLQKVLKSLYATQRLNAELGLFSHFFIDQLLHNVIRHNCDIYTEDPISSIVFNIKIDLNDQKKPSYQTIFNNLTAIFEFLQSTLGSHFESDCTFIEVFAQSIRDKFFSKVIEDCIRNNLPSCDSSYQHYKNVVVELDSFNKFLIDLKFVEANESPLNKYIDDTECVLYNKKCDKLLSDVRDLLCQSLTYGTIVVGSGCEQENGNDSILNVTDKDEWDLHRPLFLLRCVISQNVKKIMAMIVEHLEESAKLPEKYRNQLVGYVKDIAVMYQCVVPKKFKVNLECCPTDIALFFNNCFFLAHGLVGPPWCSTLPQPLANRLTLALLECIQDLRVLGLEKVSLYLQKQKNVIMQSLEAKDPSAAWTHETYEQFSCAVNDATSLLRDLKACWAQILPAKMYQMCQCTLAQVLYQAILERVFGNMKPMSEELVYMLAGRIQDVAEDVERLFEMPVQFEDKISNWTKFTKLPQLLNAQLLEMLELWNKKDQLQCFTCEEVRQIVKIRFPDDKYRLKILKEIQ